jgi:hypothetical protein
VVGLVGLQELVNAPPIASRDSRIRIPHEPYLGRAQRQVPEQSIDGALAVCGVYLHAFGNDPGRIAKALVHHYSKIWIILLDDLNVLQKTRIIVALRAIEAEGEDLHCG